LTAAAGRRGDAGTRQPSRRRSRLPRWWHAAYLDPATASRITYLLAALSHACHYHPYELAPTAPELTTWLDQAAHLITQLHAASTAPAPPSQ
jgi:hypothetical protein